MPDSETTPAQGLPAEISNSLATVWSQYASKRPTDTETVMQGNRVKCVLTDAVGTLNAGFDAAESDGAANGGRRLTPTTFRNDAMAAVRRVTKRNVLALMSDHDTNTDVATEIFLLEPPLRRR